MKSLILMLLFLSVLHFSLSKSFNEDKINRAVAHSEAVLSIKSESVRTHMEVLADNEMKGREAGTSEYRLAASYIAKEFEAMGLKKFANKRNYFQDVNFFETRLIPDSASLTFLRGNNEVSFTYGSDYAVSGSFGQTEEVVVAPLVFVGHGIKAPEYQHDDFSGVDVKGKILVVLSGAPPHFDTDQRAYYSSSTLKKEIASHLGAVGMLHVRTPVDNKRRPWEKILPQFKKSGMRWLDKNGSAFQGFAELKGNAVLSPSGAKKFFQFADHNLEKIFGKHASGKTGSFDLGVSAKIEKRSAQKKVKSANVIGLLEGSDPKLKDEYIIYTAHLDHLGVQVDEEKIKIFNGAYDNAAGVATVLEVASAMSSMKVPPKRSVIFAMVTAEEKGLQGSSYLAKNFPVSLQQLVANINIDMPYLGFPVNDIEPFGAEHSSLHGSVAKALTRMKMELTPDPMPEKVRFIRSDQFSFVKEGIPALAFKAGAKSSNPEISGTKELATFLNQHYHSPSDDLTLPFSHEGAKRYVQAALLLGLIISEEEERPRWNKGDFFGDKFARKNDESKAISASQFTVN
ncbi:M28 family metallopeptidase [Aliikangiella coralliicola]|uniref:M20/M25/M40 family metallo-hydrolase n=1 Tax=Aliikangiella coralliicola TaxID=2592383 RepID=A0A545UEX6_9GAMM|nr:M28 family metallopeptidase [Aliikangiella coralliicola]TQV88030.1 M20/M25/M40 family metallo-hydrolase [Aliikangiella coralliicola]